MLKWGAQVSAWCVSGTAPRRAPGGVSRTGSGWLSMQNALKTCPDLWNTARGFPGKLHFCRAVFGISIQRRRPAITHIWHRPVTPGVAGSSPVHSARFPERGKHLAVLAPFLFLKSGTVSDMRFQARGQPSPLAAWRHRPVRDGSTPPGYRVDRSIAPRPHLDVHQRTRTSGSGY